MSRLYIETVYKALEAKGGENYLTLLASGTKLDRSGDKVTEDLLNSMAAQANAGKVLLLENHGATLPMGISTSAEVIDGDDGSKNLFITFQLDDSHPLTATLIKQVSEGYEPQCSIGVDVATEQKYDPEEGGYVRFLTEGHFEHVALTRPDRNAYPDAKIANFKIAKSLDEVFTLEGAITKTTPRKAGETSMSYKETMAKRKEAAAALKAKMAAKKEAAHKEAEAEAAKKEGVAKEAEACNVKEAEAIAKEDVAATHKEGEAEAAHKDAEAAMNDPEAPKEPPPKAEPGGESAEAAPAKEPVVKDGMEMSLDSMKDVHGVVKGLHEMMKEADGEGALGDSDLHSHIMDELAMLAEGIEALSSAVPEPEAAAPAPVAEEKAEPEHNVEEINKSTDDVKMLKDKLAVIEKELSVLKTQPAGEVPSRYNSDENPREHVLKVTYADAVYKHGLSPIDIERLGVIDGLIPIPTRIVKGA